MTENVAQLSHGRGWKSRDPLFQQFNHLKSSLINLVLYMNVLHECICCFVSDCTAGKFYIQDQSAGDGQKNQRRGTWFVAAQGEGKQ